MKKFISIVGTRPQFLKIAPLCYEFKNTNHEHSIIHSGQHYDKELSEQLFKILDIPTPKYHLKRDHSSSIHFFTSLMNELERILTKENPDYVIVYGDCDTTFAGAFVSQKLGIQLIHIEAGMRSYNKTMPEEINRILTDNISNILLCTTKDSVENLKKENIINNVFLVGNLQLDLLKLTIEKKMSTVPSFNFEIKNYVLLTIHRNYNTTLEALTKIFKSLSLLKTDIIFPLHPRTRKIITDNILVIPPNIKLIKPVSYFEMVSLLQKSSYVITDSGGLQPECWFLNKRCIILRNRNRMD